MLSILTQFLSNRSQNAVVNGCRSKPINDESGVPQGSDPVIVAPVYLWAFFTLVN